MAVVAFISTVPTIIPRLKLYSETLMKNGFDVRFIGWDRRRDCLNNEMIDGLQYHRIPPYVFQHKKRRSSEAQARNTQWGVAKQRGLSVLKYVPQVFLSFYRVLKKQQVDIVHCTHAGLLPIAVLYGVLHKKRTVYEASDFYISQAFDILPQFFRPVKKVVIALEGLFVRYVDAVCCIPSKNNMLYETYRKNNTAVKEIYNVPVKKETINKELYKKLKRENQNHCVLIYAGSILLNKGVMAILRAVREIKERHPDIKLLLVGSAIGDDTATFEQYVEDNDLCSFVSIISYQPYADLYTYYKIASIGIGLIQDEYAEKFTIGGSRKLIEYMKASLALLVTDRGEVGGIASKEMCGVLCDIHNDKDIRQKIEFLLENRGQLKLMQKNGKKAFDRRYNWNVEKQKLIDVYQGLDRT